MSHKIVHWELMGPDGGALAGFYRDLFGWSGESPPGFDHYDMISAEQAGVGGAVGQGSAEMASYLTMYVEVDHIDEYLTRIEASGGHITTPRTVLPGMVTFAMFTDPAGNLMGLVETETPPAE
jgi:predicted enzyme related to lactoylglutathione lyase